MKLTGTDISALYEAHADAILKFAMRRTFDAQVSVDVVGETFAVAFEQRKKYRGSSDVEASSWLFGIANNLLKQYFRSGAIERRAMEKLGVEQTVVPVEEFERIEALAGSSELRGAVRDALADLSLEQRTAVRLRVVDELPYPLVAEKLDVSEEVARARVSRGLKQLRERLDVARMDEVIEHV
ncbi:MAG: sigma-70 family RNA polymerase sigma factor [Thermoleophilaceae bacterium]|nr:sigma-70 family RNA polymerase sigma factor [Thermoleophilaceae bacterium]